MGRENRKEKREERTGKGKMETREERMGKKNGTRGKGRWEERMGKSRIGARTGKEKM